MTANRQYPQDYCLGEYGAYGACLERPDHSGKCRDAYGFYFDGKNRRKPVASTGKGQPWFAALSPSEFVACYKMLADAFGASVKLRNAVEQRGGNVRDLSDLTRDLFDTWQEMFASAS